MENNKKGQAAMEFLMTYGWAILVAIIAIGVLAYYGVFSPGKFVSAAATINAPFGISEYNIQDTANVNHVNLIMIQNSGDAMATADITVKGTGTASTLTCTAPQITNWNSGATQTIDATCSGGEVTASNSFGGDITVSYTKTAGGLTQLSTGSIRGTVQ
jgi:hypothetical protein